MRPSVPRIIRDINGNPLGVVDRVRDRDAETAICGKCSQTFMRLTEIPDRYCERCR